MQTENLAVSGHKAILPGSELAFVAGLYKCELQAMRVAERQGALAKARLFGRGINSVTLQALRPIR